METNHDVGVKSPPFMAGITLIIEDEEQLQQILSEKLAQEGFEIVKAYDGDEGVKLALSGHPDLILLDLLMPKVDGIVVLEKIRADAWGKNVPVLVLTNLSDVSKMESAVHLQVSGYLVKSDWKLEDVVAKIREILHIHP